MIQIFWAILANPMARLILVVALASGAGFVGGWSVKGAYCDQASAEERIAEAQRLAAKSAALVKLMTKQANATTTAEITHSAAASKIKTVYREIEKEVLKYVPAPDDDCWGRPLPDRAIGLWNNASAGALPAVPKPAAKPDNPGGTAGPAPR